MNKQQELLSWLNDGNRGSKKGIELYKKYGINRNLFRFYDRISDEKTLLNSLNVELLQIAGLSVLPTRKPKHISKPAITKPLKKPARRSSTTKKPVQLHDPFPNEDKRPEILQAIYEEKNKLYVKAKNLFANLIAKGDVMDNEEFNSLKYNELKTARMHMAKNILKLWEQVNDCWKKIDYFSQNGKLPDPEILEQKPEIKADVDDPITLDKRWRTLGTYISKAMKEPERNQVKIGDYIKESNSIAMILNKKIGSDKYLIRSYETLVKSRRNKEARLDKKK